MILRNFTANFTALQHKFGDAGWRNLAPPATSPAYATPAYATPACIAAIRSMSIALA